MGVCFTQRSFEHWLGPTIELWIPQDFFLCLLHFPISVFVFALFLLFRFLFLLFCFVFFISFLNYISLFLDISMWVNMVSSQSGSLQYSFGFSLIPFFLSSSPVSQSLDNHLLSFSLDCTIFLVIYLCFVSYPSSLATQGKITVIWQNLLHTSSWFMLDFII